MANGKTLLHRRRFFNEPIDYYICVYCGIWTSRKAKDHACHVCAKNLPMEPIYNRFYDFVLDEDQKAQLRGEIYMKESELYQGCTELQRKALETGNVELLLEVG